MVSIEISPDYGYVIIVLVISWVIINWLALQVVRARKKYEVKYPAMYSDKDPVFNCIQRAHQNTLEGYPVFLVLLLLGGLQYPCLNAGAGMVYLVSRVVYAKGYYTGDPEKRNRGAFGYFGLLTMLGSTIALALRLLGYL